MVAFISMSHHKQALCGAEKPCHRSAHPMRRLCRGLGHKKLESGLPAAISATQPGCHQDVSWQVMVGCCADLVFLSPFRKPYPEIRAVRLIPTKLCDCETLAIGPSEAALKRVQRHKAYHLHTDTAKCRSMLVHSSAHFAGHDWPSRTSFSTCIPFGVQ